jgi:hypothetical protein
MLKTVSSKIPGLILLSAGVLIFEITLTRLFAIQQFHHFAFVVVSLAVMGFAASGVILSLRSSAISLAHVSFGFSLSVFLSFITINFLPFDSYSIASDPKQVVILLLYFSASGLPFLLAGLVIGASLSESGTEAHKPYAANFVGSAAGCLLALILVSFLGGETAILLSGVMGLFAGAFFTERQRTSFILTGAALLLIPAVLFIRPFLEINLSPYKPLSITRLFPDADGSFSQWSSSSRLDVIETNSVHVFPGMSLNVVGIPPGQIGFFIDGDGPIPVTNLSPQNPLASELATNMPSGVVHELRPGSRMLLLQPGGGLETILALASGVESITLATDEPLIIDALQGPYQQFSANLLDDPRISISPRSSRGTLASSSLEFNVIQFALTDSFRPITSGAFSLGENYILTVESLKQAYSRLEDDGLLILSRWLGTPPSESARAWATLVSALRESGITDPAPYLVAFRDMRTGTMIASAQEFTGEETALVREFLNKNSYDPIHLPDLELEELNQHNQLPEDRYYSLFSDLLRNPEPTLKNYEFNLRPPRDDRPFFYHFFRWRQTPDVLTELGSRWLPFGGSGYLVLLVLLGLMLALAFPVTILPLLIARRRNLVTQLGGRFGLYFGFLGAGYLLIEIPLIQQFTLLLDRPTIAFAVVLFSLLLSSGIGSWISKRVRLRTLFPVLIGYLALLIIAAPGLVTLALGWSVFARVMIVFALLSPAGLMMGIPFAAGLSELERVAPGVIPWAWAINGAISGIAGVFAAMIALDLGLRITLLVGVMAYAGAYFSASKFEDA